MQDNNRYSRQMILPEIGAAGQQKLAAAKVLVIGAGGLGCPALQYLATAGVGTIAIVDDDTIDITNLHRQILYTADDIGKNKAIAAKAKLQTLNPEIQVIAITDRLTEQNASELISQYDIVVDGSDNFDTRYVVGDTCAALQKPLVFGSIYRYEGQVSVFNYKGGPAYRAIFPEPSDADNCEQIGVLGVLPGIVGSYMASEVIKIACGIGETLSGKLLVLDILENTVNIYNYGSQQKATNTVDGFEISYDVVKQWQEDRADKFCIVDVRESYEFEEKNIGGINISLFSLQDNLDRIPADKDIVFVCDLGNRSRMAYNIAKDKISNRLYHLKAGIKAAL
jgi:adenylyltransferase/sulfurtransferase